MTDSRKLEGRAALEALLSVQDDDSAIDALEHRRATLSERAELAEHQHALALIGTNERDTMAARRRHENRLAELASEVAELVARAARIDERLRSGAVASFRDQEAMATEMGNLDRFRHDLDDEQLIVMEAIEPLEKQLAQLADAHKLEESAISRLREALGAAESEIDGQIAERRAARGAIAATVPDALLSEYARLRARLGGVGAARVVSGMCGGCHLTLSATEIDHLRHAREDEVVNCEQCGRILVP